MSRIYMLLAMGTMVCSHAMSQDNYLPGKILLPDSTTKQGWIDFRQWYRNPETIRFTTSLNGEPGTYSVQDIAGFSIDGKESYTRAAVAIDKRPVELQQLQLMFEPDKEISVTDTVFLRTISGGPKFKCYAYVDEKDHFFTQDSAGNFKELTYKVYLVTNDRGVKAVNPQPLYRNQLMAFAFGQNNYSKIVNQINTMQYAERDMVKFAKMVNGNTGSETTSASEDKAKKVKILVAAGGLITTPSYSGNSPLANMDYTTSFEPMLSAGIEVGTGRNLGRLIFRFDMSYAAIAYKGTMTKTDVSGRPVLHEYDFEASSIAPSLAVLYNIVNNAGFRFYLGPGLSYHFMKNLKNTYTIQYPENIVAVTDNYGLSKDWLQVSAVSGITFKKRFDLQLKLRLSGTYLSEFQYEVKPGMFSFQLGYLF